MSSCFRHPQECDREDGGGRRKQVSIAYDHVGTVVADGTPEARQQRECANNESASHHPTLLTSVQESRVHFSFHDTILAYVVTDRRVTTDVLQRPIATTRYHDFFTSNVHFSIDI
ncbi:hypothetical protein PFISCL1PPCAC_8413, partial [Pristionchus fissidentatus]